ncbi:MAG: hypothetical protein GY953_19420 [bacterium]|nr:hypothetical protein [bacterium]
MREPAGRCPVCQARFRGERICSRCGANIEPLMALIIKAYLSRRAARRALASGNVAKASRLATAAQETCSSSRGERLCLLTWWLAKRGTGW